MENNNHKEQKFVCAMCQEALSAGEAINAKQVDESGNPKVIYLCQECYKQETDALG